MKKQLWLATLLALTMVAPAHAILVNNYAFWAEPGETVQVTFVGSIADDLNLVFYNPTDTLMFNNQTTPVGTTFNLGPFAAQTELVMRLDNLTTENSFFTGPASNNPDQLVHVAFTDLGGGLWRMGWEDRFGGNDFDFNDLILEVRGRSGEDPIIPEPATMVLVVTGLAGMAGAAWRKRRSVKD